MKKLLLALGSIAAVAAPVASVVACGAPKPIKLDKSKIEGMRAEVKTGLVTALHMSDADAKLFDEGTVTEDKGQFVITYKDTTSTDNIVVVVNADAEIQSAIATITVGVTQKVQQITSDQLKAVQQTMTDATHETIRTKEDFDINDYDADVVAAAGTALIVPQAKPGKLSNDEIKTFNAQVDAFQPAYEQTVANQAADVMNAITETSLDETAYDQITLQDETLLTESVMDTLGFKDSVKTELLRLINDGAEIKVGINTAGGDMSGFIICNGNMGTLRFAKPTTFSA